MFVSNINATIIVALRLKDGIVIAADSRVTHIFNGKLTGVEDTAEKIVIVDDFAVIFYGAVSIGNDDLLNYAKDINFTKKEMQQLINQWGSKSEVITIKMQMLFQDKYSYWFKNNKFRPEGGFIIAGFGKDNNKSFLLYNTFAEFTTGNTAIGGYGSGSPSFGLIYKGQTEIISRLIYGVSEDIATLDFSKLGESGLMFKNTTYVNVLHEFRNLEYIIPYKEMSVGNGIEFAKFLVQTTIDIQKYSNGAELKPIPKEHAGCGGPVKIIVITKDGIKKIEK